MKNYLNNLKVSVLEIIKLHAKWNYITTAEIRDLIKQKDDFIWDSRIRDDLADNYGILSHISSAINSWRNGDSEGKNRLPIISGKHGKGYTWAGNFKRKDIAEIWDDKFTENEKRKSIPIQEKKTDEILFGNLMGRLMKSEFKGNMNPEIREKLLVVAKKHKLKKR